MKFVAYYRVSTARQGRSGLGLEAQRQAVLAYITGRGELIAEVTEVETGTNKSHRPQLAAALAQCRIRSATLVIAKLDRLSRNVAFVSNLMESNVEFTACDFPQANRLTIHILAAVAEHEASMISSRTKNALAAAKRKGVALGGLRKNSHTIYRKGAAASLAVRRAEAQRRANDLLPVIADLRSSGAVTLVQIADGLNQRQIPAPRGGCWTPAQVFRLQRAADSAVA